jgi:hypothetical protein
MFRDTYENRLSPRDYNRVPCIPQEYCWDRSAVNLLSLEVTGECPVPSNLKTSVGALGDCNDRSLTGRVTLVTVG